jgi:hypothetical protein
VTTKAGQAFDEWRSADEAARSAERLLQRAWNGYALGQGSPPSNELIHDVGRLRAKAHDKLTNVIAVVGCELEMRTNDRSPPKRSQRPSSR